MGCLAIEYMERHWISAQGRLDSKVDVDGVEDCIHQCKACTPWAWPRGSRLMFWKFPLEWQDDYRDGIPFCQISEPPKGYHHNMAALSCEAELLTRVKIFKLKFN